MTASPSKPRRRRLGIRDQKRLWLRAGGKCECCQKDIDFTEMQVGHKTAHSKGGVSTLANSVCLCYRCNNVQGTEPWAAYQNFCRKIVLANPTVEPTEEEPHIDDINRYPERLGTDQPLKLFPNFRVDNAAARNIKMYYKVMDRFVELADIVRSENEIKQSVINVPGTIAKGGSAYLTSLEEGAGILFPTTPGLKSVVLWLTYNYGANGKGMVIFDLRYDGQKPLSKHPPRYTRLDIEDLGKG